MLKELKRFIEQIGNTTKDNELAMLDYTMSIFRNFGIDGLPLLISELNASPNKDVDKILNDLGLGKRASSIEKLENLLSFSRDVVGHEEVFKDLISNMPNYVTDKTIVVRDIATLEMLGDINSLGGYIVDLMLVVAYTIGNQEYLYNKRAKKFYGLKSDFNLLFSMYSNKLDSRIGDIRVSSTDVAVDLTKENVKKSDAKLGFVISGFTGNPFYHIRMAWVDVQMWRIKNLEDKKTLFNAKLVELRTLRENGSTKDVSKQIIYYQEQIEKTDYKIHKLSEV